MPRLAAILLALSAGLAVRPVLAHPPVSVVVRPGDSLGKIAKRYGVAVSDLRRVNGLKPGQRIFARQRLTIPSQKAVEGSTTPSGAVNASAYVRRPAHPGYLVLLGARASWKGMARVDGSVPSEAQRGIEQVLAFWKDGETHAIDSHLVELLVDVSDRFGSKPIHIVSGYRPHAPNQFTEHSRHNLGEAVDFVVEGVPNEVVRDYCRTLGAVGVGYYPNSSFVHLDVRSVATYWVDQSGPGEAPRYAKRAKTETPAKGHARGKPKKRASAHRGASAHLARSAPKSE